jgi:hypothetical protein
MQVRPHPSGDESDMLNRYLGSTKNDHLPAFLIPEVNVLGEES